MISRGSRGRGFGWVLVVAAAACAAAAPGARAAVVNRIVATVDGRPITQHQLDEFIRANGGTDPASLGDVDRRRALDVLINDLLVKTESQDAGIGTSNEEVDAYIDQIKKRNNLTDERLLEALEAQGLTMERYREQVRSELQRSALVSKEIRSRVNITPEEVERYYKEHPDEFQVADSVRAEHIYFAFRPDMNQQQAEVIVEAAKKAYEELRGGAAFETVGREAASGPGRAIVGDLGELKKGQVVPAIENVVFTLKVGEVSVPTQGPGGIHIFRVTERASATTAPLDDVRDQIKEKLYAAALEQRYQRWVDEDLRKDHEIVIR